MVPLAIYTKSVRPLDMCVERKSTFNIGSASARSMKNAVDFHSDRSRNFREFSDLTGRYAPPSRSTGYEFYRKRGEREEISCNHYDDTERSYGGSIRSSQCGRYDDDQQFARSIDLLTQICPEQG